MLRTLRKVIFVFSLADGDGDRRGDIRDVLAVQEGVVGYLELNMGYVGSNGSIIQVVEFCRFMRIGQERDHK